MEARSHLHRGVWSTLEHERFLAAIKQYPNGPWHRLAASVGTRSPRQVQTHAHKFFAKIRRRQRGLQRSCGVAREHRIDDDVVALVAHALDASSEPSDGETLLQADQENHPPEQATHRRRRFRLAAAVEKATPSTVAIHPKHDSTVDKTALPSIDEALDFFIAMLEVVEITSSSSDNDQHVV